MEITCKTSDAKVLEHLKALRNSQQIYVQHRCANVFKNYIQSSSIFFSFNFLSTKGAPHRVQF